MAGPAEHPVLRGDGLGDARCAGDQPCAAQNRDPGDSGQPRAQRHQRADREAGACLLWIGRLSAQRRRRQREEGQIDRKLAARGRSCSRAELAQVESVLRPRGGEDGAARRLLGDADRNPRSGAGSPFPGSPIFRILGSYSFDDPACQGLSSSPNRLGAARRNRERDDEDGVKRAAPGSSTTRWGGLRCAELEASGRSSARSSELSCSLVLKSGLVAGCNPWAESQSAYFYAMLAFLAGFSERRAMVMLGGAEKMLGGSDGTGGDDGGLRSGPTGRGPTTARQQDSPPQALVVETAAP